ncbi:hypothetical protein BX666DRAFT_1912187 [Dichotomocladium elegans]|nr:hypothetical protein BX666DRAFT_1912187 [Dichotomocladium elegans]
MQLVTAAIQLIKRLAAPHGVSKPGYSPAQLYLGNCYGEGAFNVEKSAPKAFHSYWLGSKQHDPECTYRVAVCYQFGIGTTKNMLQAAHYLRKSARLGFVPAMYKLGMMMLQREGQERRQGVSWLKRAVLSDPNAPEPEILHTLAAAYETPGYALVPDLEYSLQLYHKAADLGYSPSQYRLALAYATGNLGCKANQAQALHWAEKAASKGEPDAEFFLSRWHLSENPSVAYFWADRAANKGNVRAMVAMAYYKEHGIGTEKNLDEAKRWLKLAADKDDPLAKQRIRELQKKDSTNSWQESCNIM